MKSLPRKSQGLFSIYLLILAAVIAAMFLLKKCSAGKTGLTANPELSGGDTLNVAIDYSPVSMYVVDDTVGGFNHDILMAIAPELGRPVKFHPIVSLADALNRLDRGDFDIVVADLPVTLGYQSRFRLTEPVYTDRQVLIQHVDTLSSNPPVNSVLDLARRKVWVVDGSPVEGRLRNLSAEIGDTIYVMTTEDSGAELLYLLTSIGQTSLAVINEEVARAMSSKNDSTVRISTKISFTQFQAWAINRDSLRFGQEIDSIIRNFKQTDDYKRLTNRYFHR